MNYDFKETVLEAFRATCSELASRSELPLDPIIRFLDLVLRFGANHVSVRYEARARKQFLRFYSSHSEIVKPRVATLAQAAALDCCEYQTLLSFATQIVRLQEAGYARTLISAIREPLL